MGKLLILYEWIIGGALAQALIFGDQGNPIGQFPEIQISHELSEKQGPDMC